MDKLNIVLVLRSGGDFKPSDVALLAKNLFIHKGKREIQVFCLFDKIVNPITVDSIKFLPMEFHYPGWWAKLNLFAPELDELRPFLYMDLDTAIIGDYSELIPEDKDDFVTVNDFYKPGNLNSTLMWIPNCHKTKEIHTKWKVNPMAWIKNFRGDQDFIGDTVGADKYYQDITDTITSFKPNRMWLKIRPTEESVVCFHGNPRIPKAAKTIEWVDQYQKGVL